MLRIDREIGGWCRSLPVANANWEMQVEQIKMASPTTPFVRKYILYCTHGYIYNGRMDYVIIDYCLRFASC